MKICAELHCEEKSITGRGLSDPISGRKYYIELCLGHADEFDSYHMADYCISEGGGESGRANDS